MQANKREKIKIFIKTYQYVIFAGIMTVVVLGRLLLPGYVILLDWPAGSLFNFQIINISSLLNAPVDFLLHSLNLILPGWIIQKILMLNIFFWGFYLPLKLFKPTNKKSIFWRVNPYFISLLNVFNPFVYERFLAGQWRVVVGYLAMLPLLCFLIKFQIKSNWQNVFKIFLTLFIVSLFSIHFFAMAVVIIFIYIVFRLISSGLSWLGKKVIVTKNKKSFVLSFQWFFKIFIAGLFFLIISSYWLVPYTLKKQTILTDFDLSHQRAFATAHNKEWTVAKNVIMMHGFWGEDHLWVKRFILPKETVLFQYAFWFLLGLIFLGLFSLLKNKKYWGIGLFLSGLLGGVLIFSLGIYNNPWREINKWLLENIFFWKGFRDSQKWTGVVVAIYILLAGKGVGFLNQMFADRKIIKIINILILFLPILLVPQILFGFQGQIKTTWYPQEWQQVNNYLKELKQKDSKILFLPWHQYYSLKFNQDNLSANPSGNYFSAKVVSGRNTELWNIKPIANDIEHYKEIEKIVISNNPQKEFIDKNLKTLKKIGFTHIIWTNDMIKTDLYKYPFLNSDLLSKIIITEKIILYKLN